jgi:hypothetical protein
MALDCNAELLEMLSHHLKLRLMLTAILCQNPKLPVPRIGLDLKKMPTECELSADTSSPPKEAASPCNSNAGDLGDVPAKATKRNTENARNSQAVSSVVFLDFHPLTAQRLKVSECQPRQRVAVHSTALIGDGVSSEPHTISIRPIPSYKRSTQSRRELADNSEEDSQEPRYSSLI